MAVAVGVACCEVDAAAEPPLCAVDASFAAIDGATATFCCVIGPLLPGLFTRTITTRFTGCCCVAVAVEAAL
ncbi:MAG TPA: hypothetical protein VE985_11810 [Gaiellaceae bacterium]|nr:hypothetical protein [Gaiellaceae bacterium]